MDKEIKQESLTNQIAFLTNVTLGFGFPLLFWMSDLPLTESEVWPDTLFVINEKA